MVNLLFLVTRENCFKYGKNMTDNRLQRYTLLMGMTCNDLCIHTSNK